MVVPLEAVRPDLQLQQAPLLATAMQCLSSGLPPPVIWTERNLETRLVTLLQQTSRLATREMVRGIPRL
jgi:hypothetical protein